MKYFEVRSGKAYCTFYNGKPCETREGLSPEEIQGMCEHIVSEELGKLSLEKLEKKLIDITANRCHTFAIKMLGITIPAIFHKK